MILNVLKHHLSLKELVGFLFRYLMSVLLNGLLCEAATEEYKRDIRRKLENDYLSHFDRNLHTSSAIRFLNFVRLLGLVKFGQTNPRLSK